VAYYGALLGYISWLQADKTRLNIISGVATSSVLLRERSFVLAIVPSFQRDSRLTGWKEFRLCFCPFHMRISSNAGMRAQTAVATTTTTPLDVQQALNLLLEDDDDDDDTFYEMMYGEPFHTKKPKYSYQRIDWNNHVQEVHAAGPNEFHIRCHMSETAFNSLVEVLADSISVNEIKSRGLT
jgi:hypothetical protein